MNGSLALLEKEYVKETLRLDPKYKSVLNGDKLHVSKDWFWYMSVKHTFSDVFVHYITYQTLKQI